MDTVDVFLLVTGIALYIAFVWRLVANLPKRFFSSWDKFHEQLEEDKRWWACQEGPGCDWPDSCTPGDCRRVKES